MKDCRSLIHQYIFIYCLKHNFQRARSHYPAFSYSSTLHFHTFHEFNSSNESDRIFSRLFCSSWENFIFYFFHFSFTPFFVIHFYWAKTVWLAFVSFGIIRWKFFLWFAMNLKYWVRQGQRTDIHIQMLRFLDRNSSFKIYFSFDHYFVPFFHFL